MFLFWEHFVMRQLQQTLIIAFFVFTFLVAVNAQQIPPSYGFLEVVDSKNEPVPDASVSLLNNNYYSEKTNQNGRIEKGLHIYPGDRETPFSIEKTGFYTFVDYYGLFGFLSGGFRNNRENPIKIELLKIPENRAERKIIGNEQQKREFFGAARTGDAIAVRKFIKSGLSPNLTTSALRGIPAEKDVPVIMFAAKSGNGETVKEFLSAGVKVRRKEEPVRDVLVVYLQSFYESFRFGKYYPQTDAEKKESLNAFETGAENLIDAGAEINSGALQIAVTNGYLRTVKKLIAKGANINAEDYNGATVLHTAVGINNRELIEFLLENGANPNAIMGKDNSSYYYCNSPLMMAVERGEMDLIKLLLGKKADPNLTCQNGKNALRIALKNGKVEIFEVLVEAGADVKAIDESGENNLMYAVRYGNVGTVRQMITERIPVNARNKQGLTALMIAVSEGDMNLRLEKVATLLTARADPNIFDEQKFTNYYNDTIQRCETALIKTVEYTDPKYFGDVPFKIIDLLVANGANVNFTCENSENAVKRAVRSLQVEGLKKLIQLGADIKGEKGKAVLEYAKKLAETNYYKLEINEPKMKEILEILNAAVIE